MPALARYIACLERDVLLAVAVGSTGIDDSRQTSTNEKQAPQTSNEAPARSSARQPKRH